MEESSVIWASSALKEAYPQDFYMLFLFFDRSNCPTGRICYGSVSVPADHSFRSFAPNFPTKHDTLVSDFNRRWDPGFIGIDNA